MKKAGLIIFILFLIGCSSTSIDDGTNIVLGNKGSLYDDDGTNRFARTSIIRKFDDIEKISIENGYIERKAINPQEIISKSKKQNKIKNKKESEIRISKVLVNNKNNQQISKIKPDKNNITVVSNNIPKQNFDSNENIKTNINFFYPTQNVEILKDFNNNSIYKNPGLDFKVAENTPIKTSAPGLVIFSGKKGALGNSVFVYHNEGFISIYYNLNSLKVEKGDYVKLEDDIIGHANEYFHYELRKQTKDGIVTLNPKNFLQKRRK